ncbi:MAG: hypothetical protein ACE5K1_05770 [Acidiferrobacterales bacterium]
MTGFAMLAILPSIPSAAAAASIPGSLPPVVAQAQTVPSAEGQTPLAVPRTESEGTTPLPTAATPEPWVDQLIDPTVADEAFVDEVRPEEKGLGRFGPGGAGFEYRYFGSKTTGAVDRSLNENGLGAVLRQETLNFGRLDLRAAVTNQEEKPDPDVGSGEQVRLIQTDLPLNERWLMDNGVGHVRAATPLLIATSYRLRLPAPVVQGLSSRLRYRNTAVAVTTGELGILRGRTFPVFQSTSGDVAGAAATHHFDRRWRAGLQYWDVKDARVGTTISTHTSTAGALEYQDPVAGQLGQFHLLRNDGGELGAWLDGELRPGRWRHNFGLFRLDPGLLWIDETASVANDRQGAYWNASFRKFGLNVGAGLDFTDTNIDADPTLTGRETLNAFTNVSYQFSRRIGVDGSVRFIRQRPGGGRPSPNEDVRGARGTVSYRFTRGTSLWTLGYADRSGGTNPGTNAELLWDFDWRLPGTARLRTGLEHERDKQPTDTRTQTSLRVTANQNFGPADLNTILSFGVAGDGVVEEGRTSSLNVTLNWRFARAFTLGLNLNYNKNVVELVNGQETRVSDRNAFVSVRYDLNWGAGTAVVGQRAVQPGHGRIAGTVFLDANRNGVQEPDEAGVPNITVYLDGGFSVETDDRGRFAFWPVPAGDHALSLGLDNVPLPWGLRDERPRQIHVTPRGASHFDYALTTINE